MVYLSSLHINTDKRHPYPYDIPAIKFAKHINVSNRITFIIGENGSGKSTLLEALACRLQLPHMDGGGYGKKCFDALLIPNTEKIVDEELRNYDEIELSSKENVNKIIFNILKEKGNYNALIEVLDINTTKLSIAD